MRIFVKDPSGNTISLEVDPSVTVENLKEMLKDKEGTPTILQRLIFKGIADLMLFISRKAA